ncbi:MAG: NADH-quinone oxidoreductase subunit H [Thermoprotei archaeon]|jgi:NADH-quinone oxidoreductase subunit H|nr:NADH-quinone oxidoreductase subunit H [Thermoprotei archaeon]
MSSAPLLTSILTIVAGIIFFFLSFLFEWVERKAVARIQKRVGPYFTGPGGIFQPFVDFLKLLSKTEAISKGTELLFYRASPIIGVTLLTYGFLHLPFLSQSPVLNFNGDLLVIFIVFAFTCLSYLMAGLSLRTPFTVVGTGRLIVQYSLYELIFLSSFALIFFQAGSATISDIVRYQMINRPLVLYQPIGFIVAVFSLLAKLEKPPFDLPHAKQEVAAGWMSELSGRTLAYMRLIGNMDYLFSISLIVTLFLGGGSGPFASQIIVLWPIYFLIKALAIALVLSYIEGVAVRVRSILLPMRLGIPLTSLLVVQAVILAIWRMGLW